MISASNTVSGNAAHRGETAQAFIPPIPRYYKLVNRKLSFADCWCLTQSLSVIVLWIAKILHLRMDLGTYVPEPQPFQDCLVGAEDVSPECAQRIGPVLQVLIDL